MEVLRSLTSALQVHSPVILISLILHSSEESSTGAFSRPISVIVIMASATYDACRPPKHLIYRCACAKLVHCWNSYLLCYIAYIYPDTYIELYLT